MPELKKIKIITIFFLMLLVFFSVVKFTKAENKIYIENGEVYYLCPDGPISASSQLNIDIKSVKIINDNFFSDKSNVYVAWIDGISRSCGFDIVKNADPATFKILSYYYEKDKTNVFFNGHYKGGPDVQKIENADTGTFIPLGGSYAKDKNNVFCVVKDEIKVISEADPNTFEVLKEDEEAYAIDKKNMYYFGEIMDNKGIPATNLKIYNTIKGKIILKVESNGEAYYVNPTKKEIYYLSRPVVAFQIMRKQGTGITDKDLEKIPVAENYCPNYSPSCDMPSAHNLNFAKLQNGKIFLQVEENGEAWYVNPNDSKRYFLGRPMDAFNVMKNLGLGISDANFENLTK